MSNNLSKQLTVGELVFIYRRAVQDVRAGFELLSQAANSLNAAFTLDGSGKIYIKTRWHHIDYEDVDDTIDQLRRQCWSMLVERLDIRRCLSIERAAALDRRLEKGELPDITVDTVAAFAQGYLGQLPTMLAESVIEVYDWLRPRQLRYKTDSRFELKERAITRGVVDASWSKLAGRWSVCHHYHKNLTALENVFTSLDGKGLMTRHYQSSLQMAIEAAPFPDGRGETPYFVFRACRNGNLHLRFKRADLLARFNAIAGGKRLKEAA